MARKPRNPVVAAARRSQRTNPPIRFIADWDYVTATQTISYKAGMVLSPDPAIRAAALAAKTAVIFRA
ncbi:hypothetical protein GCM10023232_27210 [Sphingosinicella ginsenosidimutans]|uniref:Uncharacterized protein n=1 Tax=Allosphingosinicella ginsenosidimutans TaxID=1176539 RepID=A0A5C6TTL3_9SPHN|nr:hypothetical protein [Sphingosinicella ginsenosidimutans]TXC63677.1 hypothetical protein FRZ32_08400 [Sphingosinicella ginsenosidimutans]